LRLSRFIDIPEARVVFDCFDNGCQVGPFVVGSLPGRLAWSSKQSLSLCKPHKQQGRPKAAISVAQNRLQSLFCAAASTSREADFWPAVFFAGDGVSITGDVQFGNQLVGLKHTWVKDAYQ
jgi:hypothetical protein